MSKRTTALIVLGMVAAVGAIVAAVGFTGGQSLVPATASSPADKRWLAVAPGRVEPRSGQIKLGVPIAGVVDSVLAKVNDTVFAGEPLIQLKDDELAARLAAAVSQVAVRKRARNDQSSSRADERRKAEDAVAEAEQSIFGAQDAVDNAAAKWRASGQPDATLTNARADLSRAQDELTRRKTQLRRVEVNAPLPTATEGQLIAARADLTVARAALEKLTLRAPIDGTVLQVNIKAGELAVPSALQPLILLANLSVLRVRAELDERDVTGIKIGQPATVRANAFPGREFAGKVTAIAPLIEPAHIGARGSDSRTDVDTVEVLVDLAQPGPLTVGMRVDVYFDREAPPTQ
jgi:HlyD family secretion protein